MAIALLLICAVAVWLLYKDKILNFFTTKVAILSKNDTQTSIDPQTEAEGITIRLNGKDTVIPQVNDSTAAGDSAAIPQLSFERGSTLDIILAKKPAVFDLVVYKDDTQVLTTHEPTLTESQLQGDGTYHCIVEMGDGNDAAAMRSYSFTLAADFPPELLVSSTEIKPGELLVICANNLNEDQNFSVETEFNFKPNCFSYQNKRVVLLPVSYTTEAEKVYQVKVYMAGESYSYAVRVDNKEFTTQYLTIDKQVAAATRNEKSAQELADKVTPLKTVSDPEPYWTGKFILPVEGGRVSEADFGKRRYVNDAPTSYRHNGLDIGQDKGTPVKASNNGRVLLAEFLTETGNTVIIEHGFGLKTWYYHMDELNVKEGDWVKQGDMIGKVGSTGFSTSPHLHFSASVNQVYINPITLMHEGVPLLKQEE
ncbi:MAG: M23 family metallopeptidase [Clostridia bacterium]|nr:M23 family metallopeptidase [Clostridia bacterium]